MHKPIKAPTIPGFRSVIRAKSTSVEVFSKCIAAPYSPGFLAFRTCSIVPGEVRLNVPLCFLM